MARKYKCKQCEERDEKFILTPKGRFCGYDCAITYANCEQAKKRAKAKDKAKQSQVKIEKANRKAHKANKDNDRKHQFRLTKQVIQKWVNHIRDAGLPCISCETTNPNIIYSGGHYRTAGGNPEIALESKNIHRQCLFNCNKNKSGNIPGDKHSIGFKQGLINRKGEEFVEWLDGPHDSPRLDCEQLRELRAYYNRLIREKKKTDEDRPFF